MTATDSAPRPQPFWKDKRPVSLRPDAELVSALQRASPGLTDRIKRYLFNHFERLEQAVAEGGSRSGGSAGQLASCVYDGLLTTLFLAAQSLIASKNAPVRLALGAVGSYGRGVLSLASDVDLRLLYEGDEELARKIADAILYPLWDARVPIGHQVMRGEELLDLAREDLRTATTLLDWRHLCGERGLWQQVTEKAEQGLFSSEGAAQIVALLDGDSLKRQDRFGGSVYLLEPDLKLGPGGLRDLDVVTWVARARWRASRLEDLVRLGVLVPREVAEIRESQEHLWRVRNQLHQHAARRSDRLTFDEQERLASVFGFGEGVDAVEAFMSAHYKHASVILQAREQLCQRASEPLRSRRPVEKSLGPELKLFDGKITFASSAALVADPSLSLRLYDEAVRTSRPLYSEARKALRRALQLPSFRQALFSSPEAQSLFLSLCCAVQTTALRRDSVLGDLHDVGLLTAMIPEFLPLVGRVHHDAYHVFTVDLHSIAAVDWLRSLARGELLGQFPLACRLAAEVERPQVLFLATLLHDIGKAIGRHDHAIRGAEVAREISLRLGLCQDDAIAVSELVREHLKLYHLATRRDVEDPAVLEEVLRITVAGQRLRDLYLLTFADVATTNPEAMSAWKAGLLDALLVAAEGRLGSHPNSCVDRSSIARSRLQSLSLEAGGDASLLSFLESMPERYLQGTAPERLLQHSRFVQDRAPGSPVLRPVSAPGASTELCVIADDRPGLLASIAAVLATNRLAVLEAQIYSRTRADGAREAVDLFFVRSAGEVSPEELARLAAKCERDLSSVLLGTLNADEMVQPRLRSLGSERRSPAVKTEVAIDNRASAGLTVVEVFTRDRPALLFLLARTFRDLELSIQLAKINTEGTRVADVFYVSEANGSKLESVERIEQVRLGILASLENAAEGS